MTCSSYMFRCTSHHLQGDLTYSLLETIYFYEAVVYGTLVALLNTNHTILFVSKCFKQSCIVYMS